MFQLIFCFRASGLGQEEIRERALRMAVARCAPLGDVREFGEASAFDGPVGCDLWIIPPVLHADVSQMVGEDVHDGLASGVGGFVDDLVHVPAE